MPRGIYERKADRYPRLKRHRPLAQCAAPDCDRLANRRGAGLCEMHYGRLRAHGALDKVRQRKPHYVARRGYIRIHAPGHPASAVDGYALEHRVVFHDAYGPGPFDCHWCGKSIKWTEMHVDHLNAVTGDNRLDNLVASCPPCNRRRGLDKMRETMRDRFAVKIHHDGETLALGEWAQRLGISRVSLKWRLENGWTLERALTAPRGKSGPKRSR